MKNKPCKDSVFKVEKYSNKAFNKIDGFTKIAEQCKILPSLIVHKVQ